MVRDNQVALPFDSFAENIFRDIETEKHGGDIGLRVADLKTCVIVGFLETEGSEVFDNLRYFLNLDFSHIGVG